VLQADVEVRWGLAPGQGLLHRAWNGETLLFNDLSGDTHLLDGPAMAMLVALQAGPLSEAALRDIAGWTTSPHGSAQLEALLANLEALSLIQTC
jgi:PqqD family protein of HPr-rel-A system